MDEVQRKFLSESDNGKQILVDNTAPTVVHRATDDSDYADEVTLYVFNSTGGAVVLTVILGGEEDAYGIPAEVDPDNVLNISIASKARVQILDKYRLRDNAIACQGASAGLVVDGYANRVSLLPLP